MNIKELQITEEITIETIGEYARAVDGQIVTRQYVVTNGESTQNIPRGEWFTL
jgi:hypothetical protein